MTEDEMVGRHYRLNGHGFQEDPVQPKIKIYVYKIILI